MSAVDPPPLITECPNCHTRFRVGESQLQMAHGRVRCGACLAVFAGVDHLLLDESAEPPDLPAEPDALESVLAELSIDEDPADNMAAETTGGLADAAPIGRNNSSSLDVSGAFAREQTSEVSGEVDWTSVSVDTREIGGSVTRSSERRATIEEALNDEEALRWWLEDELPGDSGASEDNLEDAMVVQLSQLDSVQEEELDLRALIGAGEEGSSRALEELFSELPEDAEPEEPQEVALARSGSDAVAAASNAKPQASSEQTTSVDPEAEIEAEIEAEVAPEITEPLVDGRSNAAPQTGSAAESEGLGEQSATELQQAIDQAEPLVSRAMANGTIAAAAARMAENRTSSANTKRTGPVALVESPHQQPEPPAVALPEVPTPAVVDEIIEQPLAVAEPSHSQQVQQQPQPQTKGEPLDSWNSTSFPETPAELVVDISEEMAAAGQPDVAPEPGLLERAQRGLNAFLGHALALRMATLLAFALLTGQILYWQFADWSKTPTLRPVYAGLCSVLGCELPARRSLRDLQSRKLAVRSHPEQEGALLVDALIINEAEFEQPFPVIELQFMDIQQQLVGSYRLEPSVYLDGELAGSSALMSVRTPVHIDIEIPDPGPKAVNYQLQFR